MFFPVTGIELNPLILVGIGFVVGILGGFFGVGGGFLAGPLMYWSGVPMNYVVGTDLAHMTGKSVTAIKSHRALGHVDFKLGALMILGTLGGVELGASTIERLEGGPSLDVVIGSVYIVILALVGGFTFYESRKAIRMIDKSKLDVKDAVGFQGVSTRVKRLRIFPMISLPNSGIESISLWVVLVVGFISGFLSGMLGVGGGFIRMPLLIYVLGVPTHVAVGTDLFEILFSSGYGTFTHALKGNVDLYMALILQIGAVTGTQIGSVLTKYYKGPRIRMAFSFLPFIGIAMVLLKMLGFLPE